MREIKFRAWHEQGKEMVYFKNEKLVNDQYQMQHLAHLINGDYGDVLMQYTELKDRNDVEIYEGDLLNIYFTSSDGEYIHDCIYKAEIGALGGVQFQFVELLWIDSGRNQYPASTTLCERYDTLDYEYENNKVKLKVPDSWGENHFSGMRWKQNDKSFYFEVIGNIYENPELLESL